MGGSLDLNEGSPGLTLLQPLPQLWATWSSETGEVRTETKPKPSNNPEKMEAKLETLYHQPAIPIPNTSKLKFH